ncbi:AAA family ATPase [Spirosoma fluviale]|uniref:ATPase/GTPase, AAA15 family n=1 Tax=Spirosoma fluviale TaxID=1597977 RepID=A0A286GHB4_9BACT|nr:ATP-binding protein [Spirosoma fluviale]SOD94925.1 ATPase/GTPase, AAA15 family [Spirosoma fluviale]
MLRSLEIQNYRNLRHLTIEKLGRVNLLVGKNNTGKTSVLEAVAIYASLYNESITIKSLLQRRGEYYTNRIREVLTGEKVTSENNLASLSSLYTDYIPKYFSSNNQGSDIYIGEQRIKDQHNPKSLAISFRKAYQTLRNDGSGREIIEYVTAEKEEDIGSREFRYEIHFWRNYLTQSIYSLNSDRLFNEPTIQMPNGALDQFQYVDSKNQSQNSVEALYSKIALSDKEDIIVNALKIIEPQTERFSLIENSKIIIKLTHRGIRNLSSMGDGVSRVFSIILAMVNCEGAYLLIDEFENGLHYSVQEKLWEIIFYLAERLNIQVFATTHSNDTIKAFGEVAKVKPEYNDAQLIKLRNVKGEISAVLFSTQDVEIATETDYLDLR